MAKVKQKVLNIGKGTSYTKGHQSARETHGVITGWSKNSVGNIKDVLTLVNEMPAFFPGDTHFTPRRVTKVKWEEGQKAHVETTYSRRRGGGGTRDRQSALFPLFNGKTVTDQKERTYFKRDGNPLTPSRKVMIGNVSHYVVIPRVIVAPVVEIKLPVRRLNNPVLTWERFYNTVNGSSYLGAKRHTVRLVGMTWKAELVNAAAMFDIDYFLWLKPDGWQSERVPVELEAEASVSEVEQQQSARVIKTDARRSAYREDLEPLVAEDYGQL